MRIRRGFVDAVDHFTVIPNDWVRDPNLSRRARGMLAELLSHQEGWEVSIASLTKSGKEGRDAVRATVNELEEAGYISREERRSEDGLFQGVDFVLTGDMGRNRRSEPAPGNPSPVEPSPVEPVAENPTPKKNISKKTNPPTEEEEHSHALALARDPGEEAFDEFWAAYPKRVAKKDARKAFARAIKKTPSHVLVEAARVLRDDPNLPELRFVPNAATWINGERWEDGPLPPRNCGGSSGRLSGTRPEDWLGPSEPYQDAIDVFEYRELA